MTVLVGVVTQEASLVGLLAALAMMTFLVISYLLLVVSTGSYGIAIRSREADRAGGAPDGTGRVTTSNQVSMASAVVATGARRAIGRVRAIGRGRASGAVKATGAVRASGAAQATPANDAAGAADVTETVDVMRRLRVVPDLSKTAENYASTVAPALRAMAVTVVGRAQPRIGDRVLDVGTGIGIGARAALSAVPTVVGIDAAEEMLEVARRDVPGAHFIRAELAEIPFPTAWFHVVISIHALQLTDDPAAVLAEWRRVTIPGGRLSLSVPGPRPSLPLALYDPVYQRHGITRQVQVATARKLASWARAAGWQEIEVEADPKSVIRLGGPESFARWLRTGGRLAVAGAPNEVPTGSLERDLLAVTPTGPDGQLRIPFGTLYLTARNL